MHNSVVILFILCLLDIYGYEMLKLPMIGVIILIFKKWKSKNNFSQQKVRE